MVRTSKDGYFIDNFYIIYLEEIRVVAIYIINDIIKLERISFIII